MVTTMNPSRFRFPFAQAIPAMLAAILLLAGPPVAGAAEREDAGRVLVATTGVTAEYRDQDPRELARRSEVHVHDTVRTPEGGRAQLRMIDGEILSLSESSELYIDTLEHAPEAGPDAADRSIKRLLQGGLRTITGTVAGDGYRVETRAGTIGIRGTSFDAFTRGDDLYVHVRRGALYVENPHGRVEITAGTARDAAYIRDPDSAPQALQGDELPDFFFDAFEGDVDRAMADDPEPTATTDPGAAPGPSEDRWGEAGRPVARTADDGFGETTLLEHDREVFTDATEPPEVADPDSYGFVTGQYSEPGTLDFYAGRFLQSPLSLGDDRQLLQAEDGEAFLDPDLAIETFVVDSDDTGTTGTAEIGDASVSWGRWTDADVQRLNDIEPYDSGGNDSFTWITSTGVIHDPTDLPGTGTATYSDVGIEGTGMFAIDAGSLAVDFGAATIGATLEFGGGEQLQTTGGSVAITEFHADGIPLEHGTNVQGRLAGRFVGSDADGAIAGYEIRQDGQFAGTGVIAFEQD